MGESSDVADATSPFQESWLWTDGGISIPCQKKGRNAQPQAPFLGGGTLKKKAAKKSWTHRLLEQQNYALNLRKNPLQFYMYSSENKGKAYPGY